MSILLLVLPEIRTTFWSVTLPDLISDMRLLNRPRVSLGLGNFVIRSTKALSSTVESSLWRYMWLI